MMFDSVLSLNDVKRNSFIIEHIRWDIEPKDLMEPRLSITDEGTKTKEAITGYIFYIDVMDKRPILCLMRHTAAGYAETLAQIDEIPNDLLIEAIEENKNKACFGMYPINKKVEEWLKRELGVF